MVADCTSLIPLSDFSSKRDFKLSGVYGICNRITGKWYVGSSRNIYSRIIQHRHSLTHGKHHSDHFQKSFNLYGINAFYVEILEKTEPHFKELVKQEKVWMDRLNSVENGYNIIINPETHEVSPETVDRMRKSRKGLTFKGKAYSFYHPNYGIVSGNNIERFCKQHGLVSSSLRYIRRGICISHHGWTLPNPRERGLVGRPPLEHKFLAPSGEVVKTKHIEKFADDHGLNHSSMFQLSNGSKKSYKGWRKA